MTVVAVTGASGKAGRAVVRDLSEHGYEVRAIDIAPAPADLGVDVLIADLTDYGQAMQSLDGCDTVVHLANIPAPGRKPDAVTFNTNITMNYAVFTAAVHLRADRVVWASSETTLGLPFDTPPRYAPIDEAHYPYPTTAYALSKVASETIAEQIAAWSGLPFIALRLSNIHAVPDYAKVPGYWADPRSRRWNAWGYIDERDVALACRLALTADVAGAMYGPAVRRPARRGLPPDRGTQAAVDLRDPALDRQGAGGTRLRAPALLARRGQAGLAITPTEECVGATTMVTAVVMTPRTFTICAPGSPGPLPDGRTG